MTKAKQLVWLLFVATGLLFTGLKSQAQKVLNQSETKWVMEAQADLKKALTAPALNEAERLKLVEKSAKTLKEYGQPSAYPDDDVPLKEMMEENYEECKTQIIELSDWSLNLEKQSLDQKLKVINTIQISVVEEQIKLLIPGSAPIQLSQDVVSSVFGWNIAEGFNGGQRGDAKSLASRFKQLAERNELIQRINVLVNDQKHTLELIDKDLRQFKTLEAKLKQKYAYGEATTFTIKGYEGALLYGTKETAQSASGGATASNPLVGKWKFGYQQTGYFYWTFNNDRTFVFEDKMNGDDSWSGKYSVNGNTLTLYGPENECAKVEGVYPFEINEGELEFGKISDKCMSRQFTLNHVWKK